MQRIPEPELMDEASQAAAYAHADFASVNEDFAERTLAVLEGLRPRHPEAGLRVLDLGCGPADIPLRVARARPDVVITAVDGALAMLRHAAEAITEAVGRGEIRAGQVRIHHGLLPDPTLASAAFDAVVCNSLLHHLHDPGVLWRTITRCGRPGAHVLVTDLRRPADLDAVDALVTAYAAGEPEVLRRDFHASLCAAFEPAEVKAQLRTLGVPLAAESVSDGWSVDVISDRHLAVRGHVPRWNAPGLQPVGASMP